MGRIEKENAFVILGAVPEEVDVLIEEMQNPIIEEINGYRFFVSNRKNHKLVIGITGCGCMNGALVALTAIYEYEPVGILNIGTCGSYREDIHINDVIVVNKAVYMGDFISKVKAEGEGSNPFLWQMRPQEYVANDAFLDEVLTKMNLENVRRGVIGTSDFFNREKDRIRYIRDLINVDCEDMETAAIYKTAAMTNTPVVAFRIISNNELTGERDEKSRLGISREAQIKLQNYCRVFLD